MFEQGAEGWGLKSIIMLAVVFLIFPVYDALAKSPLGKEHTRLRVVGFVLIALIVYAMIYWAEFSYRAYSIHTGVMFGTIMVANVLDEDLARSEEDHPCVEGGMPRDALLSPGPLSGHANTYLSVPLSGR